MPKWYLHFFSTAEITLLLSHLCLYISSVFVTVLKAHTAKWVKFARGFKLTKQCSNASAFNWSKLCSVVARCTKALEPISMSCNWNLCRVWTELKSHFLSCRNSVGVRCLVSGHTCSNQSVSLNTPCCHIWFLTPCWQYLKVTILEDTIKICGSCLVKKGKTRQARVQS